jgi:hypothetical protein
VSGNQAEVRGVVTEVTGAMLEVAAVGDEFLTDVEDNGAPSSGTADRIQQADVPGGPTSGCAAPMTDEVFAVDDGNVSVHD